MNKLFALSACVSISLAAAQAQEDLPDPPKPPKSFKLPPDAKLDDPAAPEKVVPGKPVPRAGRERNGNGDEVRRPVRVRVVAPFVDLNLDFNRDQREMGVAPVDIDVNAGGYGRRSYYVPDYVPAYVPAAPNWRYRWHEGRWWYWMPSERWMVHNGDRWVDYNDRGSTNGDLRLGTPDRGRVRVKIGDLPGLDLGF
jgi:hypothetical protein